MLNSVIRLTALLFVLHLVPILRAQGAGSQFLFLDDWSYELIDYWINGGELSLPYVLNQPYDIATIERGLRHRSPWVALFKKHVRSAYGQLGKARIGLYGRKNLSWVSNRIENRRPYSAAPARELFLFENKSQAHFNIVPQIHLIFPGATLVNRTMLNSEYRDDRLYAGDNSESLFGRVNDAYLNLGSGALQLFAGRIHRNWGGPGTPGLILSGTAYTYDHLQMSFAAGKLKFSMLLTRLEDVQALFDEVPDSLLTSRRYMTAHRFDYSPMPGLQMAVTEISLYGGPGQDFEFAFMNPMNLFYLAQRNQQVQSNGLWAFDLFFKPMQRISVFMQLLVDDFIINNEPGIDDRARSPDRLGIYLRLSEAGLLMRNLQTRVEYTRIGNRTYQARRTWENFHYRGKSLGFPRSSTEQIKVMASYFGWFPALLALNMEYARSGNVRATDLFPVYTKEPFPIGPVERVWRVELNAGYFLNHWSRLKANILFEKFENYNNTALLDETLLSASIGADFDLNIGVGIDR